LVPPRICPSSTTSTLVTDCQRLRRKGKGGGRKARREGRREGGGKGRWEGGTANEEVRGIIDDGVQETFGFVS
jgi:hypothetical protein